MSEDDLKTRLDDVESELAELKTAFDVVLRQIKELELRMHSPAVDPRFERFRAPASMSTDQWEEECRIREIETRKMLIEEASRIYATTIDPIYSTAKPWLPWPKDEDDKR